jgi:hypothetical protein
MTRHTVEAQLRFKRRWKGPIEGFVVNFAKLNAWRVQPAMDEMDLYQEAWILFNKCVEYYPEVEPKHFMALFKTALHNRMTTLAQLRTRRHEVTECASELQDAHITTLEDIPSAFVVDEMLSDAEVRMMLEDAPDLIKTLIRHLGADAETGHKKRSKRNGRVRETAGELLARITGKAYNASLMQSIKCWINGENGQILS